MTVTKTREYKRLDAYSRKTIDKSIKKLEDRYNNYKEQNIVITNLFGDDILIHDIIDKEFYVFKTQENRCQIRLLYCVNKETNNIDVISFFIKNRDNNLKKYSGRYQNKYLSMFKETVDNFKRSNRNERSKCLRPILH